MKKRNQTTRLAKAAAVSAAVVMTTVLSAAPSMLPVCAAENQQAVIDPQRTGTLVIHKIIENDGQQRPSNGLEQVTTAQTVDNVGFDHVKLASLRQLSGVLTDASGNPLKDSGNLITVGTYYVDEEGWVKDLFHAAGAEPEPVYLKTKNGLQQAYTTEGLEDAMQSVITTLGEERINQWVNAAGKQETDKNERSTMLYQAGGYTDGAGTLVIPDLALGLYIVAETDLSGHDGRAGAWNDGVSGNINRNVQNTYDEDGYHIQPIDGWGDTTRHTYRIGEMYREAQNPEAPVLASPAAPFLVSLPTTNTTDTTGKTVPTDAGGEAGTVWQYTVNVYPKNQTTAVYKRIIDPDEAEGSETLRTSEDYQIGDRITQVIWADAPVLQKNYLYDKSRKNRGEEQEGTRSDRERQAASINRHLGYVIADRMTLGLSFDQVREVLLLPKSKVETAGGLPESAAAFDAAAGVRLSANEDYQVVDLAGGSVELTDAEGNRKTVLEPMAETEGHGFAVVLTDCGLTKLDACTQDSVVAVKFDAVLNPAAVIGQVEQNMNYPELHWVNTNTSFRTIRGNEVYDYTYELQLKKNGVTDGRNVKFIVARIDRMKDGDFRQDEGALLTDTVSGKMFADADDSLHFVKEAEGVYHVWGYLERAAKEAGDAANACEQTTINGIDYYTVTPAQNGTLVLKGLDSNDYRFKEIRTEAENNLLKEDFCVSLRAKDASQDDPLASARDGKLVSAVVTTGGIATEIQIGALGVTPEQDAADGEENQGIAAMEVTNHAAIDLRTGGTGTKALYLTGGVLAVGIGISILGIRKKNRSRAGQPL